MGRRHKLAGGVAVVALCATTSASAFSLNFDYQGSVGGGLNNLGFNVVRTQSGSRKVQKFTLTSLPITCSDSLDTVSSGGFELHGSLKVNHRRFSGKGDWSTTAADPSGSVEGKLRRNGTAVGTLKLRGELAGPGTHCHTGGLDWTAARVN
jgi:hypothetical protein